MKEDVKIFVIGIIDKLAEKFSNATFTYGFDTISNQHLINVDPPSIYTSEEYMSAEFDSIDVFMRKFPAEEILFVSNDKYIKIEKVIHVRSGKNNLYQVFPGKTLFQSYEGLSSTNNLPVESHLILNQKCPIDSGDLFSLEFSAGPLPQISNRFPDTLIWEGDIRSNAALSDRNTQLNTCILEGEDKKRLTVSNEDNYAIAA